MASPHLVFWRFQYILIPQKNPILSWFSFPNTLFLNILFSNVLMPIVIHYSRQLWQVYNFRGFQQILSEHFHSLVIVWGKWTQAFLLVHLGAVWYANVLLVFLVQFMPQWSLLSSWLPSTWKSQARKQQVNMLWCLLNSCAAVSVLPRLVPSCSKMSALVADFFVIDLEVLL